jgi:HPt (histidine-containing phosphotransfer) domain-containing protein
MIERVRVFLKSRFRRVSPLLIRWQPKLFVIAIVVGIASFTIALLVLDDELSEQFSLDLKAGLEARARHGAQELATVWALGTATNDIALFNRTIDVYMTSPDVRAIAIEVNGKILASRGELAPIRRVFAARPGELVDGLGYVASWAAGPQATKIAVVMSTRALREVDALQARISYLTLLVGAGAIGFGLLTMWLRARRARRGGATEAPRAMPAPSGDGAPAAAARRELERGQQVLQHVLDHTTQGFVVVDLATQVIGAHAKIVERWFGAPTPESTLAGYVGANSIEIATKLSIGLAKLHDGSVGLADGLAQMPARMTMDGSTFEIRYVPILDGDKLERVVLVMTDVTEQLARERAVREAREARDVAALVQLISTNRAEFDEFFAEIAGLVASLDAPAEPDAELRTVRTLKDNCAYYGLDAYVELCTTIEASLRDSGAEMDDAQRVALSDGWSRIAMRLTRGGAAAA